VISDSKMPAAFARLDLIEVRTVGVKSLRVPAMVSTRVVVSISTAAEVVEGVDVRGDELPFSQATTVHVKRAFEQRQRLQRFKLLFVIPPLQPSATIPPP
jgi:hypothetical protein